MSWLGKVLTPNGSITKSARKAMDMASGQATSMETAAGISSLPRGGLKRLWIGETKSGVFTRNSNLAQQGSFLPWTSMETNFRIYSPVWVMTMESSGLNNKRQRMANAAGAST